jgi:peptidyl-prolyl cis-trans isomerase C
MWMLFLLASSLEAKQIAMVGRTPITVDHLLAMSPGMNATQKQNFLKTEANVRAVTQEAVDREVLAQAALKDGVDQSPELKAMVQEYTKSLLTELWLNKKLGTPSKAETKSFYNDHKDWYSDNAVRVQSIFVTEEAKAAEVFKEARKKPELFADLARKYSEDPQVMQRGSDLLWIKNDQPGTAKLFRLAYGTVQNEVGGPVETPFGYIIFKVLEKRFGKLIPFVDAEPMVQAHIQSLKREKVLEGLRAQSNVSIDLKALGKVSKGL